MVMAAAALFLLGTSVLPGQPAPAFEEPTAQGRAISLADLAGQTFILEWIDDSCPYAHKHYTSRTMQALQRRAAAQDVVWLQVSSSAPGQQGHLSAQQALTLNASQRAEPTLTILDHDGSLARSFGAKTAPHMFIVDEEGTVQYNGAIDTIASPRPADIGHAQNYVAAALGQLNAGGEVVTKMTKPYGCALKLQDG